MGVPICTQTDGKSLKRPSLERSIVGRVWRPIALLVLALRDLPALAWRMVCPEGSSPLIVVVGPTGAGKSSLGLRIAEQYSGEMINCDSLQFYRGFDIGTAKTPEAD